MNQIQRIFAYDFKDKRYDVGEKIGFVKTIVEIEWQDESMTTALLAYPEEVMQKAKEKNSPCSY